MSYLGAGCVGQSVASLTQEPEVPSSMTGSGEAGGLLFVFPSADLRRAIVGFWRKYVFLVLVNFRKFLMDHAYMTVAVYQDSEPR